MLPLSAVNPLTRMRRCLSTLLLIACFSVAHAQTEQRPNVIIILTDDMGWGDLSHNGNPNIETPNIDRIGLSGAAFENFYVQPVCSPTRAELLTGRYAFRSGVYSTSAGGERMDLDERTIADDFRDAGYRTAAYGKWHNGMQYPYHPNGRGFEDFYGFCSGHWGHYFSPMLERNGAIVERGNGFVVDDFTGKGLEFMEANRDQPFFLYLPFNTPHTPAQVPERNWANFRDRPLKAFGGEKTEEDFNKTRALLSLCQNIDENVGRILAKLEELDITDNTILLFFSDNGPIASRWNGGMKGGKGTVHEGGVRSPLLIQWPGKIPAGSTVTQLAAVTDLLPTLSELCNIQQKPGKPLDGISIESALLSNGEVLTDRYLLTDYQDRTSVRNQRFRYVAGEGLYDIENDRNQTTVVSDRFAEVTAGMQAQLAEFLAQKKRELPAVDKRTFPLGHPDARFTQVPARDGVAHNGILRSNQWPNCSFFMNWTDTQDSITWTAEVMAPGTFAVHLYYACPPGDEGSDIQLKVGDAELNATITEAHDSPLYGMDRDRFPRIESYVKNWKRTTLGNIELSAGAAELALKATRIPGETVMDFRLLLFERVSR